MRNEELWVSFCSIPFRKKQGAGEMRGEGADSCNEVSTSLTPHDADIAFDESLFFCMKQLISNADSTRKGGHQ